MRAQRRQEVLITLGCYGVSGAALALGMWIAAGPVTAGPAPRAGAQLFCAGAAACRAEGGGPALTLATEER